MDTYFKVELQTAQGQWFEDQRNEALWIMRAYARQLLQDQPRLAGRIRIVRCQVLPIKIEGD